MKPFDLEKCKNGAHVITRDGKYYLRGVRRFVFGEVLMGCLSSRYDIDSYDIPGQCPSLPSTCDIDYYSIPGQWHSLSGESCVRDFDLFMWEPSDDLEEAHLALNAIIKPEKTGYQPDELDPKWYGKRIRDML